MWLFKTIYREQKMGLTELKPNLWKQEAIPTEYYAFKAIYHRPIDTDAHYVAAPWSVLINTRRKYFNGENTLKFKNGFTVCQHISYADIIPFLLKSGITTLFTPHAINNHHVGMRILPFPHHAINGVGPSDKNLLCSFIGCLITHPIRKVIWDANPNRDNIKMVKRQMWHYESKNLEKRQTEYKQILSRSRFSLCPRGTGASTIRFWESLQAGAIPVLISDAMKLPAGWDWSKTIIRIKESNASLWPNVIDNISKENEQLMRANCIEAYKNFSGDNLVSNIRLFFGGDPKNILAVT